MRSETRFQDKQVSPACGISPSITFVDYLHTKHLLMLRFLSTGILLGLCVFVAAQDCQLNPPFKNPFMMLIELIVTNLGEKTKKRWAGVGSTSCV